MKVCRGVRGATTASANTKEAILEATRELLQRMILANGIRQEDVACVILSTTRDLNATFPALALRQMGWHDAALLCTHEMDVPGAVPKCIRVLIQWNTTRKQHEIRHIYLRDARHLRPDRAIEATVPLPPLPDDALEPAPLGPLRLVFEAHRLGYTCRLEDEQGTVLSRHRSSQSLWTAQSDLVASRLFDAIDATLMEARPRPIHPSLVSAVVLALEQPPSDLLLTMLGDRYGWQAPRLALLTRPAARHQALGAPPHALVALADFALDARAWLSGHDIPLSLPPSADWPDLLPSLVRHACDAALDALYTDTPSPLANHLCAALRIDDRHAFADWLTQSHTPDELAALAPMVRAAAEEGDATAQALLQRMGAHIARQLWRGVQRLDVHEALPVFVSGAALDLHPLVGQSLEQALAAYGLTPCTVEAVPTVLDGCLQYAKTLTMQQTVSTTSTKKGGTV